MRRHRAEDVGSRAIVKMSLNGRQTASPVNWHYNDGVFRSSMS